MGYIKKPIMSAFNELVQTIKAVEKQFPEQEHFISFVTFNGTTGHTELHHADPVKKIKVLNTKSYMPNGSTPLFDSMGFSILKLKAHLEKVPNHNVLVRNVMAGMGLRLPSLGRGVPLLPLPVRLKRMVPCPPSKARLDAMGGSPRLTTRGRC
jgi:hypothetical protein